MTARKSRAAVMNVAVDTDVSLVGDGQSAASVRRKWIFASLLAGTPTLKPYLLFNGKLLEEWLIHSSEMAVSTLSQFMREGRYLRVNTDDAEVVLSREIAQLFPELPERSQRTKDAHLLALGLHPDSAAVILSEDRKSRNGFSSCCAQNPSWSDVDWVDATDTTAVQKLIDGDRRAPLCTARRRR